MSGGEVAYRIALAFGAVTAGGSQIYLAQRFAEREDALWVRALLAYNVLVVVLVMCAVLVAATMAP